MTKVASVDASFDGRDPAASGMVATFDDEFTAPSISNGGAADGKNWVNHLWYRGLDGEGKAVPDAFRTGPDGLAITAWNDGSGWKTAPCNRPTRGARDFPNASAISRPA